LDELKKKRFLWGVALAWTPAVPALIGLSNALRGMSKSKGQPGLPRWLAVWLDVRGVWDRRHPHRPRNCDFLTAPGILARRLDAKLAFRSCRYA
jgi:hypothetical protein